MSDKIEGEAAIIARLANIKYRAEKNEQISVEDANFYMENKHLLETKGNQSKYDYQSYKSDKDTIDRNSPITRGEFLEAMSQIGQVMNNSLNAFREDIVKMVNNSAVNLQNYANQTGAQVPHNEKGEMLKGLVETAVEYLKSTRQSSGPSEFEQELLQRSKAEMMESVNIVSLINKKVKGALVSDIAGGVADHIMKTTSANLQTHEHRF